MSRIGKKPVAIPGGVTASVDGQQVKVKGPKGELSHVLVDEVIAKTGEDGLEIAMREDTKEARAMWGMSRTLVANLVTGVTEGFSKTLEITGVGYRAAVQGQNLQLQLGFSHDVLYPIRHQQAAGRPGRCGDQAVPAAGALQGQGRALCGRVHPPQGRQEEVAGSDDESVER
jgi:ribosomal protein L6P/L9E